MKEQVIQRESLFVTTKLLSENKQNVVNSLKDSLKKLKLEYVDLFLVHSPLGYFEKEGTLINIPLHIVWSQMEECVNLGLTKSIGVSNFNV